MRSLAPALAALGARALVVVARSGRDPCLAPFAGAVKLGASLLVAPAGGEPRLGYLTPMERDEAAASGLALLSPEALDVERWARDGAPPARFLANVLSRALQLSGVAPGPLLLAGFPAGGRLVAACELLRQEEGWSFADGEEAIRRLRKRKVADELAEQRRVARGTVAAFRRVAALLAAAAARGGELWLGGERLRVGRLRAEATAILAGSGLEQPDGSIVAPAGEGAVPHSAGDDSRALRPGESIVVDLFPCGRLFADATRTFCAGEPPRALVAAHAAVSDALAEARRGVRVGVRGWDLQERVCARLAGAGYETPITHPGTRSGYVHGLGHGVGFEVHELPSFRREASEEDGRLEAGDVFALEPGLYDPEGGWAVRIEDTHALGGDGRLEVLTAMPDDLDPRAWIG